LDPRVAELYLSRYVLTTRFFYLEVISKSVFVILNAVKDLIKMPWVKQIRFFASLRITERVNFEIRFIHIDCQISFVINNLYVLRTPEKNQTPSFPPAEARYFYCPRRNCHLKPPAPAEAGASLY